MPRQTPGVEERALSEEGPSGRLTVVGIDNQLEPGQPGKPHLGSQTQQVLVLDVLDPPPVQRVSDEQADGVTASSAKSRSSEQTVEQAPGPPSKSPGVPAVSATDAFDHGPQLLSGGIDVAFAFVDVEGAPGPVRVGGQRVARGAGGGGGGPGCGDPVVVDAATRQLDGALEAGEPTLGVWDVCRDVVLLADDLVDEALHQGPGDAAGNGRDQTHPVTRQRWSQQRKGCDTARFQTGGLRVRGHHLPVGQDVRSADVESAVHFGGHGRRSHEVAQDVAHRDGLDPGVHPAGGDHDRQSLGEIAEHLERG